MLLTEVAGIPGTDTNSQHRKARHVTVAASFSFFPVAPSRS